MGVFDILKRKKKGILDIPPPPPISGPIAKPKQRLILPKKLPEVPEFKPKFEIPKFKPMPTKRFEFKPSGFKSVPNPIFKPSFKPKIPKLSFPKFNLTPKPSIHEEVHTVGPLEKSYISVGDFKDIMEHVNEIKKKIKGSEEIVTRLNEIKNKEDKEFQKWHSKFEDIQRKLVYIDKFVGG